MFAQYFEYYAIILMGPFFVDTVYMYLGKFHHIFQDRSNPGCLQLTAGTGPTAINSMLTKPNWHDVLIENTDITEGIIHC